MGKKMSKRALLSEARRLNAVDLTNDEKVRQGCECLTEFAHSESVYGCNGCILEGQDGTIYVIKNRTVALWIYFF